MQSPRVLVASCSPSDARLEKTESRRDLRALESLTQTLRNRGTWFWYEPSRIAEARASCRYRIGHIVAHLPGATAVLGSRLPSFRHVPIRTLCCIRPLATPRFEGVLDALRGRGVELVGDFDDLLFAGPVTGLPPWAGGVGAARNAASRPASYQAALALFDRFTVATRALARRIRDVRPDARVDIVPNGLSEAWVERGASCRSWRPGDDRVIRYVCGSPSHDDDFATIVPVLREMLVRHPSVRLEVLGPLRFDPRAFPPGRVSHHPALRPYDDLPAVLASSWVAIAPLAPTEYNECKSAIKLLESAAFGCPVLAAPNDDMRRHASAGAPVLLCESATDWLAGLESLLDDHRRMHLGAMSREYVHVHAMARESAATWAASLELERAP